MEKNAEWILENLLLWLRQYEHQSKHSTPHWPHTGTQSGQSQSGQGNLQKVYYRYWLIRTSKWFGQSYLSLHEKIIPAITPNTYIRKTLQNLWTSSRGRPRRSWKTRLEIKCIYLKKQTASQWVKEANFFWRKKKH